MPKLYKSIKEIQEIAKWLLPRCVDINMPELSYYNPYHSHFTLRIHTITQGDIVYPMKYTYPFKDKLNEGKGFTFEEIEEFISERYTKLYNQLKNNA